MLKTEVSIEQYNYTLPENRIAKYPLQNREESKLLVYKKGEINDKKFFEIASELKPDTQLIFNNTRVIQARLLFTKPGGSVLIEIFCLEPLNADVQQAMATKNKIGYYCLVGKAKKWKEGALEMKLQNHTLKAEKLERNGQGFNISLSWTGDLTFAEILEEAGHTPLPPYLKRTDEAEDKTRYQTVYAKYNGSVAAPTAGLHFTPKIIEEIKAKGHNIVYTTLHVGAGTFIPVSTQNISEHKMHSEEIHASPEFIENLKNHRGSRTAVGTTSVRTLESLYWMGVKILSGFTENNLELKQWEAYELPQNVEVEKALKALLNFMAGRPFFTRTQLMIRPGYSFKMVNSIITNFHQPKSTLLLLVAAATKGQWQNIYTHALQNNYRFLSYGDSSIIHI